MYMDAEERKAELMKENSVKESRDQPRDYEEKSVNKIFYDKNGR